MSKLSLLYFKFRNDFANYFPKSYYLCDKYKTLVKSFFAGFLAGTVNLILLFVFYKLFSWPIVLSTSAAFILSFLISFTLQKLWAFRNFNQGKTASQFTLYIINAFIGLNMNGFLMYVLVHEHQIWYLWSQLMVNAVIGTYNFFVYRYLIFRKEKTSLNKEINEINNEQEVVGRNAGNLA